MTSRLLTLSFDDGGWQDAHIIAALRAANATATFYIPAGALTRLHFHCERDALAEQYAGMSVGCHSLSHDKMRDVPEGGLDLETAGARGIMQEVFQQAVECFAWPYGAVDARALPALVAAGFVSARTSRIAPDQVGAPSHRYTMPVSGSLDFAHDYSPLLRFDRVHLAGHSYRIRDGRLEGMLADTITRFRDAGFVVVDNATFTRAHDWHT